MKYLYALLFLILATIAFSWWVDVSWKASMQRGYENTILEQAYRQSRIFQVERYKSTDKIYRISWDKGLSYRCFEFENGFDEFVHQGDLLSKKKGELKLIVTKPTKEERAFGFKIAYCGDTKEAENTNIYSE